MTSVTSQGMPSIWPTCGQAWVALLRHVLSDATEAADDRGPVLEGGPVLFQIAAFPPADPVLTRYGKPSQMALYERKFTQDVIIAPFKYSYGARLRMNNGVDQLAWVTELLAARPHSKSGWISLTVPGERPDAVPCLTATAFRVRDGILHMSAIFRSQNAFTAYLNYLPLRDVQSDVARRLTLPSGPMRVYVDVPHVYLADLTEAQEVLRSAPQWTLRDPDRQLSSSPD